MKKRLFITYILIFLSICLFSSDNSSLDEEENQKNRIDKKSRETYFYIRCLEAISEEITGKVLTAEQINGLRKELMEKGIIDELGMDTKNSEKVIMAAFKIFKLKAKAKVYVKKPAEYNYVIRTYYMEAKIDIPDPDMEDEIIFKKDEYISHSIMLDNNKDMIWNPGEDLDLQIFTTSVNSIEPRKEDIFFKYSLIDRYIKITNN